MNKIIFLLSLMVITIGCTAQNTAAKQDKETHTIQAQKNDDGEYDLEVLDGQFSYFLNAIARPISMYTESTLKSRNQILVSEWNSYYVSGRYKNIIESSIDYDPSIDYGLKYEYKLYQVFAFVKWKYGLKLNGLSAVD